MKVKYGIRARGATNLLERQLQEEWWRSVNQKNVFELQDVIQIHRKMYRITRCKKIKKFEQ